jgi:hypothetical protein
MHTVRMERNEPMDNEELYERAMKAITALFNDLSVSKETTVENLHTLIGEIRTMIKSLEV